MRPPWGLELTGAEWAELWRLLRRRGVGQALAQRVRVILACFEPDATDLGVSKTPGISRRTVATWREGPRPPVTHRWLGPGSAPGSAFLTVGATHGLGRLLTGLGWRLGRGHEDTRTGRRIAQRAG